MGLRRLFSGTVPLYRVIRNDCWGFNNVPPRSPDATPCDFFLWGCVVCLVVQYHYTGLFEIIVGVLITCHLVLQMQPHVISFYGVTSFV